MASRKLTERGACGIPLQGRNRTLSPNKEANHPEQPTRPNYPSERDPMWPTGRELRDLLSPHDAEDFLTHFWGKRPLYIPGSAKKFGQLKFNLAVLEGAIRDLETRDRLRVRFVGADNKVKARPRDLGRYSVRHGDLTVCADWINDRVDTLASYCAGIKTGLSHPGCVFMTCYASPDGHGFGTHWDCQASFILQIEGSKRWRFSATPAVSWPPAVLTNARIVPEMMDRYPWLQVSFPDKEIEETFLEQVLTPGDVLYLPAGTWHQACAIDYSVALTMACVPMTAADFVNDMIRGQLSGSVDWRASVPPVTLEAARSNRLPSTVKRFLEARLSELRKYVQSLRADEMYELWTHHVASFDTRIGAESALPAPDLKETDAFKVERDIPLRFIPHRKEGSVSVYFLDRRLDLAYAMLPLIKAILKRPALAARTATELLGRKFKWQDVKPVFQELVQAGILHVDPKSAKPPR
jgi:ribosomal protein L16 Arg81 hydroxylase